MKLTFSKSPSQYQRSFWLPLIHSQQSPKPTGFTAQPFPHMPFPLHLDGCPSMYPLDSNQDEFSRRQAGTAAQSRVPAPWRATPGCLCSLLPSLLLFPALNSHDPESFASFLFLLLCLHDLPFRCLSFLFLLNLLVFEYWLAFSNEAGLNLLPCSVALCTCLYSHRAHRDTFVTI